jgi:hypothetical protein
MSEEYSTERLNSLLITGYLDLKMTASQRIKAFPAIPAEPEVKWLLTPDHPTIALMRIFYVHQI